MAKPKQKVNGESYLKKLDLANTALFPFGRVSILVIAIELASTTCNYSEL